jgi:putative glutamine amidotransferase
MSHPAVRRRPRIVVTLAAPDPDPDSIASLKTRLYLASVERAGGDPLAVTAVDRETARRAAFATMDGLMLSGGADVDPAIYGHPDSGSRDIDRSRDELEQAAYRAARIRAVPVLGICRGLQAINAFEGGWLVQHVDDHAGPGYGEGPALRHPLRLANGTRLAAILGDGAAADGSAGPVERLVNSYHHQAVTAGSLAPGLLAVGWAGHAGGELVEAVESADAGRWLFAVQCHPERTESTPPEFERLFRAFVDAAAAAR